MSFQRHCALFFFLPLFLGLPGSAGSPKTPTEPMLFLLRYQGETNNAPFAIEGFLAITEPGIASDNALEITLVAGVDESVDPNALPVHGALAISTQPSLLGFDAQDVADPKIERGKDAELRSIQIEKGQESLPMGGWICTARLLPQRTVEAHVALLGMVKVVIRGEDLEGEVLLSDGDGATYKASFTGKRVM